jgi:hypothetical protein
MAVLHGKRSCYKAPSIDRIVTSQMAKSTFSDDHRVVLGPTDGVHEPGRMAADLFFDTFCGDRASEKCFSGWNVSNMERS